MGVTILLSLGGLLNNRSSCSSSSISERKLRKEDEEEEEGTLVMRAMGSRHQRGNDAHPISRREIIISFIHLHTYIAVDQQYRYR